MYDDRILLVSTAPTIELSNDADSSSNPTQFERRVICGFWKRLLALFVDIVLLGVVGSICGLLLFDLLSQAGAWGRLIGFAIALAYFGVLNSAIGGGQTVGKRLTGIEAVNREGGHISLRRSLARYVVFGAPFYLNGLMLPTGVATYSTAMILALLIFGCGGATVYLYVFNRSTRQTLHDLVVGSYVVKKSVDGEPLGTTSRPHLYAVGLWFLAISVLSLIMMRVSQDDMFVESRAVQGSIEEISSIHAAAVGAGKGWRIVDNSATEWTYYNVTATWKGEPQDMESAAQSIASMVLEQSPTSMESDTLSISIRYGYDLGIASSWKSQTFSHTPQQWQEMLTKNSGS